MKIKTVSVNYERKINLGDFNSAAVGCTIWADVDEGEDLNQSMHNLWTMATENVKAKMSAVVPSKNGSVTTKEFFLGLPVEEANQGVKEI